MKRRLGAVATGTVAAATVALVLASVGSATHLAQGWGHPVDEQGDSTVLSCNTDHVAGACFRSIQSSAEPAIRAFNNSPTALSGGAQGVLAGSIKGWGVFGESQALDRSGVHGQGAGYGVTGLNLGTSAGGPNIGVQGEIGSSSPLANATAVRGVNLGTNANGYGVYGSHEGAGVGVLGLAATGPGIVGTAKDKGGVGVVGYLPDGLAGAFVGDVVVTGTLTKGAGAFRIDHPLDPARKYLQHSFVESPDMKNVYDGVVRTDRRGFATVTLPRYFSALNRSFRYQLTVVGTRGWRARIVKEIARNRFTIQSDKPRVKVSWQVTGIRKDSYANAHRIQVEVAKTAVQPPPHVLAGLRRLHK